MKKRIAIDADPLIFEVCEGKYTQSNLFDNESLGAYKQRFKDLANDIADETAVALLGRCKIKGKPKICLSDPDTNFRYDIYPEYKANREDIEKSKLFYKLRKWALKKYGYVKNTEADDVVSYYVREHGYIGATKDKDMLRGVAGIWFDTYHTRRFIVEVSEQEANNFTLIQTLTGDPSDNIMALPKKAGDPMIDAIPLGNGERKPFKVTEKIAIELLEAHGWHWDGVIRSFEAKGFGKKEAILNRRLIGMDQLHRKGKKWKIKMFKG